MRRALREIAAKRAREADVWVDATMRLPIARATRLRIIHAYFLVMILAIIASIAVIAASAHNDVLLTVMIDFDDTMLAIGWLVILPLIILTFFWERTPSPSADVRSSGHAEYP